MNEVQEESEPTNAGPIAAGPIAAGPVAAGPLPAERRPLDRRRVVRGAVLIVVAILLSSAAGLLATTGNHAYDRTPAPPASGYQLSLGTVYQLSSPDGVAGLQKAGLLQAGGDPQCFYAQTDSAGVTTGVARRLSIISTKSDGRDLHIFATFRADQSGRFRISCTSIPRVFVDDANNRQPGYSTLLVVLSVIVGLLGVGSALSGLSGYGPARPDRSKRSRRGRISRRQH